jgi:hypothetical protein
MKSTFTAVASLLAGLAFAGQSQACETPVSVCLKDMRGSFPLIRPDHPAAIYTDAAADPALQHVARNFAADMARVGGKQPALVHDLATARGPVVIIGTLGQSTVIDAMVRSGKLKASDLAGEWEAYRQIVVEAPLPGITRALVIVGSDRRGAVFGTYDLSEKIGVSPLYWFADVPVARQSNVYITAGNRRDQPKVRYRGFFINDESPALTTWARQKFGGFNAGMYAHVFELLLRMKGNFLWPAMWKPAAFNDDDPQNMILADQMGVVMGTSHHEPMTRAHAEWDRNKDQGVTGGAWDYTKNAVNLQKFWRGGIERMLSKGNGQRFDSVVTVGMRGDGDAPMAEGTATELLQRIVADQRQIIAEVTGKPAAQTPQVWALYKEVQDYYDHGMTVPDDVTLLFSDDNWGQLRRLPAAGQQRSGGFGVYYHFDYVGGPRNYKWLNTVQIEKTWQQMDLAYQRGVRNLWIVNVGDIKPVEFPLQFFLQMAWNPEGMTVQALQAYPERWARATFGAAQAGQIGELISHYSRLAAKRKPELVDASSFALGAGMGKQLDGGEFGALVSEWRALLQSARRVKANLPLQQHDAYFQLIEHPVNALANLYELYYAVAWNKRLAAAGDPRANTFADQAEAAYQQDQAITDAYHRLNNGKWDGMMLQTHIGYTIWQQPDRQVMPKVTRVADAQSPPVEFSVSAVQGNARIVIDAARYTRAVGGRGLQWGTIANLGDAAGAVTALPQGRAATTEQDGVRLEYALTTNLAGEAVVQLQLTPTLDTLGDDGNRIGVSIDNGAMQIVTDQQIPTTGGSANPAQANWVAAVTSNLRKVSASFPQIQAGKHVLKVWRLDENVLLQRIEVSVR